MVGLNKLLYFLVGLILYLGNIHAADILVTAEINSDETVEDQPIKGLITVTHDENIPIDARSFSLDKKPLLVNIVKQVKISPNNPLILDFYNFQLPAQKQGLYILPTVSVKIGNKTYSSIRSSYEVRAASRTNSSVSAPSPATNQSPTPQPAPSVSAPISPGDAVLRLEAGIEGPNILYPTQSTVLFYRYYYKGNIGLTEERLPLLDAQGFLKIGEKEINNYTQGDLSVNEIKQKIEAVKPGEFSFGPSHIEGYLEDSSGNKASKASKLISDVPPVVVTVLPFPEKGKPASFNGAVGDYQFAVSLLSSNKISVGDEISLSLKITGTGNLKSLPLPELCCQPGFPGVFHISDLPPDEEVVGNTKTATVKLQAVTADIKEIPVIEFSFFNPDTKQYVVQRSKSIPITIKAATSAPIQSPSEPKKTIPPTQPAEKPVTLPTLTEKPIAQPALIEIESIYPLREHDLHNELFGSWWALALLPLGLAAIIYQMKIRQYLEKIHKQAPLRTGEDVLHQAFSQPEGSSSYFELLAEALKLSLVEAKFIPSASIENENLPREGLSGEVRTFLCDIDKTRFAGEGKFDFKAIRHQALELFERVHDSAKKSGGI